MAWSLKEKKKTFTGIYRVWTDKTFVALQVPLKHSKKKISGCRWCAAMKHYKLAQTTPELTLHETGTSSPMVLLCSLCCTHSPIYNCTFCSSQLYLLALQLSLLRLSQWMPFSWCHYTFLNVSVNSASCILSYESQQNYCNHP